jgi:hypothetical protein
MQSHEGRIRVYGPEPDSHRVPAEVLAQAILGIQESALVLAAAREGLQLSERFRPSNDLRLRYTVEVGPPEEGSVAVSFELVDRRAQPTLDVEGALEEVLTQLYTAIKHISEEAYSALQNLIPDSRWRWRLLKELQSFLPKSGDTWQFGILAANNSEVTVGAKAASQLTDAVVATPESTSVLAVTGTLIKVDFESNQLWIKHPKTNKEIECNYLPEIEEELLEARREYVQVIGEFTLDNDGFPKRLSNVSSVSALNLTPINVERFSSINAEIKLNPPLHLTPTLDEESMQLLEVSDPSINLHAFAYTRNELIEEIEACLVFLWNTYVMEAPDVLSDDATDLRLRLVNRMSEVPDA